MPRRTTSNSVPAPCGQVNKPPFQRYSLYNQLLLFGRVSPGSVSIINLDGREYEMDLKINCLNDADDKISNKTKIFAVKNNEVNEKDLIEHAKKQNPLLGNIVIVKHKIELLKDFTNKFKEYPVPISIQPDVQII
ncbi:hypothetical protein EQH57_0493 [Dictyocoela roeselum]|nr:hypothetical protein EQH57_0493 [Dictyocoela roeselum]